MWFWDECRNTRLCHINLSHLRVTSQIHEVRYQQPLVLLLHVTAIIALAVLLTICLMKKQAHGVAAGIEGIYEGGYVIARNNPRRRVRDDADRQAVRHEPR
jgi:hypothetical protein